MIRVYRYGCRQPIAGEEELLGQLRLAQQLWNKLVDLDRSHVDQVRALTSSDPQVAVLEAQEADLVQRLEAVRAKIREQRQAARQRTATDTLAGEARALREELSQTRSLLREARRAAREGQKDALARLQAAHKAALKAARQEAAARGLYWGTYNATIASYQTAAQRARKIGRELRFRPWTGEGTVTVQIQGGMSVEELFRGHGQLQIDPVDMAALASPIRSVRRKAARTTARLRVASEGREPVWVELPCAYHRPIPADGRIKLAQLTRTRIGPHWEYALCLTVELPDHRPHREGAPRCAIDVGWRAVEGGMRVATLVGEEGHVETLVLADSLLARLRHDAALQAVRDKNRQAMQAELAAWLRERRDRLPDWLREATQTLHVWRSPARLAALALRWRSMPRGAEEDTMYARLEAWRKQDRHLWTWQAHERVHARLHRREIYRTWAASVATRYGEILIEDLDARALGERSAPEADADPGSGLRSAMRLASPGLLLQTIEQAAATRGARVVRIDPAWTTQTCHACGQPEQFEAARQIWHRCSHCGALWDQDENAARNLLQGQVLAAATAK